MNQRVKKMVGPQNPHCDAIGAEKYRGQNEDHREAMNRVAGFLQDNHEHYMAFRDTLLEQRYSPPGRVIAGAGSLKNVTLYNCFVMPTIHDSFTDGPTEEEKLIEKGNGWDFNSQSIMDVAKLAAITMRQGGGVGYDISTLRPKGDMIRGVQSLTDGPLAFAPIYDAVCKATSSAGNRRGAQMLVLRVDHPDIETFIRAKQVTDESIPWDFRPLRGFNTSVAITDDFMDCVASGKPFTLKFGDQKYREVDALALWDMIMRGTYDWAEPGVLFIDTINRMNNLWYCEKIAATNPCGEQPLPPYGACLLGSFNVVKYLYQLGVDKDGKRVYAFNWDQLEKDIPHVVRGMDNVIDRSRYPLPEQKLEAQRKRRMGLGVTGLANALEALGFPYGTEAFVNFQDRLLAFIANKCYQASAMLSKEKGSFPLYSAEHYLKGQFIKTLWPETQEMIKKYGIRNSHLTSIAPTGTISLYADNVSSGIEPVIAYEQERSVIMKEGKIKVIIPDYGVTYLDVRGRTVQNGGITAEEHINVLCTAQKNVDSAVSKTCNVPTDFPFDSFKNMYLLAHDKGAKGCTTYRPNGNYDEPIKAIEEVKAEVKAIQELTMLQEEDGFSGACSLDEFGRKTGACAD
jgi:ribonucleoside-diphosphate reductase alpha chain